MSNPAPDAHHTNAQAARLDQNENGSFSPSPQALRKPPGHLKLSCSLSKSDSDLLASPHCEDDRPLGGRSESLSNCADERKETEQMPSFASEWDEVRADEPQVKEHETSSHERLCVKRNK